MSRPLTLGEEFRKEFVFQSLHEEIVTAMVARFGIKVWQEQSAKASMYLGINADRITNVILHYPPREDFDFIERFGNNVAEFLIGIQADEL